VDDIARKAGASKGGVYLEFSNKDALFKAVIFRELGRYTEDWLRLNKIVRKPCGKS
jgi:AcrR family transcriptional regulator